MRAKEYAALALGLFAIANGGCTTLERLAPPGFVKYEDLAGDKPKNAVIQQRVKAVKTARDARYPVLSEQPTTAPVSMPVAERDALVKVLDEAGTALNTDVAADRAGAAAELSEGVTVPGASGLLDPISAAASLKAAIEADKLAAAADKAANQ